VCGRKGGCSFCAAACLSSKTERHTDRHKDRRKERSTYPSWRLSSSESGRETCPARLAQLLACGRLASVLLLARVLPLGQTDARLLIVVEMLPIRRRANRSANWPPEFRSIPRQARRIRAKLAHQDLSPLYSPVHWHFRQARPLVHLALCSLASLHQFGQLIGRRKLLHCCTLRLRSGGPRSHSIVPARFGTHFPPLLSFTLSLARRRLNVAKLASRQKFLTPTGA